MKVTRLSFSPLFPSACVDYDRQSFLLLARAIDWLAGAGGNGTVIVGVDHLVDGTVVSCVGEERLIEGFPQ